MNISSLVSLSMVTYDLSIDTLLSQCVALLHRLPRQHYLCGWVQHMLGKAYCEVNEYQPAALALREVRGLHCDAIGCAVCILLCSHDRLDEFMTSRVEGMLCCHVDSSAVQCDLSLLSDKCKNIQYVQYALPMIISHSNQ